jgi:hypothetical protein
MRPTPPTETVMSSRAALAEGVDSDAELLLES